MTSANPGRKGRRDQTSSGATGYHQVMRKILRATALAALLASAGCPGAPAPTSVDRTSGSSPEAGSRLEVHVVEVGQGGLIEDVSAPVQQAMTKWLEAHRDHEVVDVEYLCASRLMILAKPSK